MQQLRPRLIKVADIAILLLCDALVCVCAMLALKTVVVAGDLLFSSSKKHHFVDVTETISHCVILVGFVLYTLFDLCGYVKRQFARQRDGDEAKWA